MFVLQGAGEEKTLAVAWNAKLSDVNETRFFWVSFLFEKCYDFRGKTLFRGSFKPTAPPCGDHQKWLCNSYHYPLFIYLFIFLIFSKQNRTLLIPMGDIRGVVLHIN